MLTKKRLRVIGDGRASRGCIHVDDLGAAFALAAVRGQGGDD